MASTAVESPPELNQLFRDISLKFSPAESEVVVKSSKRIYGEQFKSVGNQDLLSCLGRLYDFGYVSSNKLTLIKEFIATKSNNETDINQRIEDFKTSRPLQPEPKKELKGRSDEVKNISEKLKVKQNPVVNLYGSAGVGKTTLAKEICEKWTGKTYIFDLREAKDMTAVYLNIMGTLELNIPLGRLDMGGVVIRIHDLIEKKSEGQSVLLLLDNVDQFTEGKGKEGKNLRTQFVHFLGKLSEFEGRTGTLSMLLTSRTQLNDSEKVTDYKLQPLEDTFSEKILLPSKTSHIDVQQKKKLLGICKGVPLLLKGTAAILKQRRKSPSDLIDVIEMKMTSQEEADISLKSKYEEDTKEVPFNSEEEGIDEEQTSVIREMFYTLPSDTLRTSAVSVSLFHGPFSASTAAKVLDVIISEAVAQLEGLVTNEIIHVVDEDAKQLMYDIHPLLRKYAESIKNNAMFYESYTEAKGRYYEHFMSGMKKIAGLIESNYVRAFNEFTRDRPNYEFAIEISLLPEYFSVPGGYHENALIVSLFNAMLSGEKQMELFHSWAEACKDDGKSGSLFRAQLRCWEARLVSEAQGAHKAFEVLQKASLSLKQVDDQSTESFKLTQGLFLYFEGEIFYQNRDYQKAIKCLNSSLDLMEGPLKLDTNLARCYNALGNCYYGLNRPEKALEFYKKALKMREELSGSDYHYDMPVYKNQIGTIHEDRGEYDEAVKCYKDALELLKELKCLGYEDEALFRRNLANVYVPQKKFIEAYEEAEKAYNIREKRLGNHPDTTRSIFLLGVIQANLKAYNKALEFFLRAWEMEKSLGSGNHSEVWRRIIEGVFDMCDFLRNKDSQKEEFRRDALVFCERFWKEEKASPQFSFTAYNKEIIDAILYLLRKKTSKLKMMEKKERALIDEYEREALWFYDGMQIATEEAFNIEFDDATDSKVLNEMLRGRNEFLDKLIEFCSQQDKHEKLAKHKKGKLTLFKKVLVRLDFVGEKELKKSTLKSDVEQLLKDVEGKRSIKGFRENLLTTWQQQWEEGKAKEESKTMLVARERLIKGILQLCEELKMKDLRKRYRSEALIFGERLWEIRCAEMEPSVMKKFLKEMKELASLIGDREREKIYLAALQDLKDKKQPSATLRPKVLQVQMTSLLDQLPSDAGKEEEEEVEADEDFEAVSSEVTEVESEEVITEGSEEVTEVVSEQEITGSGSEEEVEVESEDEAEVGSGFSTMNSPSVVVFRDKVSKQGTHWNLKQVSAHVTFPPDSVSEDRTVTILRWNSSVCSPPLNENEALVSCIIELSTDGPQSFEFNKAVTLVVSNCAADIKGYEVVAKKLTDRDTNVWSDIPETVQMRSLEDILKLKNPASSSDIPDYYLPVAAFKITQCSTFAVVCRLKSNEFTITSEGKVLSLPEYPLFSVSIPKNAVQEGEELHINVKLQEILQREFRRMELWAGPILRITGPDTLRFQEPVTIQIPLSLREESCEFPDMSSCRVRILFQESASEHEGWTEITDHLGAPASCDGMAIRFSVMHFSGFWCWLEWCAQPMVWLVREAMSCNTRRVGKAAFFAAYVSRSTRLNFSTNLRLYCSPVNERGKILEYESRLGNVYLADGSSTELMYREDKAYVFFSEGVVRPVRQEIHVCFHDAVFLTSVKVHVISRGDLTVEFCSSSERDENKLLCEMEVTLPPQLTDPDKTPVEFFGVPCGDDILHEARFTDDILAGCSGVLEEIGKKSIYDDHLSLPSTRETKKSFFIELAKLSPEHQRMCFDQIVSTLRQKGPGVEHVKDRLLVADRKIHEPLSDDVISVVAEKLKMEWKTFASDLRPTLPQPVIEAIEEEENGNKKECCRKALRTWHQRCGSQATNRKVMRCLTNMGYAHVNWHVMKELGLVSIENMPESERS